MKPNSEQLPIREAGGGGEDGRGVATPPRCCPVDPRLTAVLLQSRLKAPLQSIFLWSLSEFTILWDKCAIKPFVPVSLRVNTLVFATQS